jgi:hypothetical protein
VTAKRDTHPEPTLDGDDMVTDAELEAPFTDSEVTPTKLATGGTCWRCWAIVPVQIVAPYPPSRIEMLAIPTCVESKGGLWAWCASGMVIRLGNFEVYQGDNRRVAKLPTPHERRRFLSREDDK